MAWTSVWGVEKLRFDIIPPSRGHRNMPWERKSADTNYSLGLSHLASVAAARGDFDAVERRTHETMVMVSRSRYPWGGFRSLLALAYARAMRGAWAEAEDALDILAEPGHVFEEPGPVIEAFARVFRQLLRAYSKAIDGAIEP